MTQEVSYPVPFRDLLSYRAAAIWMKCKEGWTSVRKCPKLAPDRSLIVVPRLLRGLDSNHYGTLPHLTAFLFMLTPTSNYHCNHNGRPAELSISGSRAGCVPGRRVSRPPASGHRFSASPAPCKQIDFNIRETARPMTRASASAYRSYYWAWRASRRSHRSTKSRTCRRCRHWLVVPQPPLREDGRMKQNVGLGLPPPRSRTGARLPYLARLFISIFILLGTTKKYNMLVAPRWPVSASSRCAWFRL